MIYTITNIVSGETYEFPFQRSIKELKAFISNSATNRSEIKLFRDAANYGINNFDIQPKTAGHAIDNSNTIAGIEYHDVKSGTMTEPEAKKVEKVPAAEEVKKAMKVKRSRKKKKNVN